MDNNGIGLHYTPGISGALDGNIPISASGANSSASSVDLNTGKTPDGQGFFWRFVEGKGLNNITGAFGNVFSAVKGGQPAQFSSGDGRFTLGVGSGAGGNSTQAPQKNNTLFLVLGSVGLLLFVLVVVKILK